MISVLCGLAFKSSQLGSAPADLNLPLCLSVQTHLVASSTQTITVIWSEDFFNLYAICISKIHSANH